MKVRMRLGSSLALLALGLTSSASAIDVTCHPAGLGENYAEAFARPSGGTVGAVAVQCSDVANATFYVARDDSAAAARFTSLALAALLSGKSLLLSYEDAATPCRAGQQCFWVSQWSIWR